jgi:hydroxyacylglutathione hydrolase
MKISESVHSLRIPFRIPAGGGRFLERSVNSFLAADRGICLVDAGVAGSEGPILAMVRDTGRKPSKVLSLVFTHSHPDHIGGARAIQRATECIVAAHPAERAWIEDTGLQAR